MARPRPQAHIPDMAAYGVDRDDWQPLDWSWVADRMIRTRNYWLVTVNAAGRPHSMPVWGVWDDESLSFMFSCAITARKARNVAENSQVVVTSDDTEEVWSLEGTARILGPVTDPTQRTVWAQRWADKYRAENETITADVITDQMIVEVDPNQLFAVIERPDDFARRATRFSFPA